MCDLLGMCFNKPVNSKFIFKNFLIKESENNPDGWGIAYYDFNNNEAIVKKEPIKAKNSQKVKQLENEDIQSKIFIAHVRKASYGGKYMKIHIHLIEKLEVRFLSLRIMEHYIIIKI